MAASYETRWVFDWESVNGAVCQIRIMQLGFTGNETKRRLGRAPVLKQKQSGKIYGTSLDFYVEAQVDGEFVDIYTENPFEFRVVLVREDSTIWTGYITPELYSEPDIAPPYDVEITATDCLGKLKELYFEGCGKDTLDNIFKAILGQTENGTQVKYISNLASISPSPAISVSAFFMSVYINIDYKKGETLYDVLQYLLDTFNAGIYRFRNQWLIFRETDITYQTQGNIVAASSSELISAIFNAAMSLGKMGVANLWPIGFTSTRVEPAKKSIKVSAPTHQDTPLVNAGIESNTGWTLTGNVQYDSLYEAFVLSPPTQTIETSIKQTFSNFRLRVDLSFKAKLENVSGDKIKSIAFTPMFTPNSYGAPKHFCCFLNGVLGWYSATELAGQNPSFLQLNVGVYGSPDETEVTFPAFNKISYSNIGTLEIVITTEGSATTDMRVYSTYLSSLVDKGYKDTIIIDNNAGQQAEDVEVAVGRETSEYQYHIPFLAGLLLDGNDNLLTNISDKNFTDLDYLSLISRGYALSVALPRLMVIGKVNMPTGMYNNFPLLLRRNSILYRFLTYSWDLLTDEMDMEVISLPSAELTVISETVVNLNKNS